MCKFRSDGKQLCQLLFIVRRPCTTHLETNVSQRTKNIILDNGIKVALNGINICFDINK